MKGREQLQPNVHTKRPALSQKGKEPYLYRKTLLAFFFFFFASLFKFADYKKGRGVIGKKKYTVAVMVFIFLSFFRCVDKSLYTYCYNYLSLMSSEAFVLLENLVFFVLV